MKILIVSKEEYFAQSLEIALSKTNAEIVISNHENALEKFLVEEPTHALICEYQEYPSSPGSMGLEGQQTYRDIKNSSENEVVLRLGFSGYDYGDYQKMPFEVDDLISKLNKK